LSSVPPGDELPVTECKNRHWIALRVVFEDGRLVESGIKVSLLLNNGETRDIVLGPGAQPGGRYSTGKILDLENACDVTFPDMYDGECAPS
jgi:hypothetical protein